MRALDESALICDFAQFYGITDYKKLDITTASVLACGLPPEARIIRKMSGTEYSLDQYLMMAIIDNLSALVWLNGSRKGKKPTPVLKLLQQSKKAKKNNADEAAAFRDAEYFERARQQILKETQ